MLEASGLGEIPAQVPGGDGIELGQVILGAETEGVAGEGRDQGFQAKPEAAPLGFVIAVQTVKGPDSGGTEVLIGNGHHLNAVNEVQFLLPVVIAHHGAEGQPGSYGDLIANRQRETPDVVAIDLGGGLADQIAPAIAKPVPVLGVTLADAAKQQTAL